MIIFKLMAIFIFVPLIGAVISAIPGSFVITILSSTAENPLEWYFMLVFGLFVVTHALMWFAMIPVYFFYREGFNIYPYLILGLAFGLIFPLGFSLEKGADYAEGFIPSITIIGILHGLVVAAISYYIIRKRSAVT